jgi:hypothetical protein
MDMDYQLISIKLWIESLRVEDAEQGIRECYSREMNSEGNQIVIEDLHNVT